MHKELGVIKKTELAYSLFPRCTIFSPLWSSLFLPTVSLSHPLILQLQPRQQQIQAQEGRESHTDLDFSKRLVLPDPM